jgi:uncharacterized protein (TIGR02118 family)
LIKVVIFFRRRPEMAVAAFQQHWRERHAALVVRLPGLRRYVQNTPLSSSYENGAPEFDGIAESSFDDTRAMKELAPTPLYAAVLADEPNFIDRASMGSIITEERLLKAGPAPQGGVKRIAFVKREPGVAIEEFFGRWLEEGQRQVRNTAVRRYAQCHCRRSIYESGRTPAYDGVEMAWYDGPEALGAAAQPAPGGTAAFMLASERVVLAP